MSSTLVTGAAGFAGSHLVELLARRGGRVVGWYRPGGRRPVDVDGVSWEPVDLLDAASVREAVARLRPSAVYHCAGAAHVGQSWDTTVATLAVNVRGTHVLLEALRLSNVTARLLLPSSAMVYRPVNEPLTEDH